MRPSPRAHFKQHPRRPDSIYRSWWWGAGLVAGGGPVRQTEVLASALLYSVLAIVCRLYGEPYHIRALRGRKGQRGSGQMDLDGSVLGVRLKDIRSEMWSFGPCGACSFRETSCRGWRSAAACWPPADAKSQLQFQQSQLRCATVAAAVPSEQLGGQLGVPEPWPERL